eukprot:scpid93945/ scgid11076/ Collagen triple helix repeat-containing protein 1; Protein NMTC1
MASLPAHQTLGIVRFVAATMILHVFHHHVEAAADSCAVKRMLKAGIPPSDARTYERRALSGRFSEKTLIAIPADVLAFILKSPMGHARAIQQCILKTSTACKKYSPCLNGGQCQLALSKKSYSCKCDVHFTGDYCEKAHPASSHALQQLKDTVVRLQKNVKVLQERTKYHGTGCNLRTLGYKYQSRHSINSELDEGLIASMRFRKKHANTVLKLSYTSNIRTYGANAAARWYFMIDNRECARPTAIDVTMHQSTTDDSVVPSSLTGICESTTSNGANIAAGHHTIAVHVGRLSNKLFGNPYSGWRSTSILEIQEMC